MREKTVVPLESDLIRAAGNIASGIVSVPNLPLAALQSEATQQQIAEIAVAIAVKIVTIAGSHQA